MDASLPSGASPDLGYGGGGRNNKKININLHENMGFRY